MTKNGKPWFSFIVEDSDCDVKVSVFNKSEELNELIKVGSTYLFTNAQIRLKSDTSKKFDHCKSEYEVSIKDSTIVELEEAVSYMHNALSLADVKASLAIKAESKPDVQESAKVMVKVISVQASSG